jgi:hypothetical protein
MSGLERARGDRHAADQPAAADRHHQRVEVGHLLEHLERDRAGPAMILRVVERVDEHQPSLASSSRAWRRRRRTSRRAGSRGAMLLGLRTFISGVPRHDDGHRNAEPLAVIGDRLRMVAGRRRDHAARALLLGQLQQFVERAALLVGGGELEVLELQPDLGADDLGQVRL